MMSRHRAAHARIWTVLAVLLPLALVGAALLARRGETPAPVRLSPAEARP